MAITLVLIARLTIFVRQRPGAEFTQIDGLAALQIILVILTCAVLFVFSFRYVIWERLVRTSGSMFVLYYVFSGFSAIWSPLPVYSFFRAIEYLSQILIIFVVIWYSANFSNAERRVLFLSFIVLLLGVGLNVKFRGLSLNLYQWHTNHYSVSAAMVFCYCFGEVLSYPGERLRRLWLYGLGALAFLVLGTSIASFFAAGMGVIVAILLSKQGRALFMPLLLAVSLTSGLIVLTNTMPANPSWIDLGERLKIVSSDSGGALTLSFHGRSLLWEQYLQEIVESPIYGHGFAVSARLAKWYTTNTHNGFLAALLGTGVIGLTIMCWGWFRLSREIKNSLQSRALGTVGCAAAFTAALINNMSISFVGEQWRDPSFVFVSILALYLLFILKSKETPVLSPQTFHVAAASWRRAAMLPLVPLTPFKHSIGTAEQRSLAMNRRHMAWHRGR